ncbi:MAG: hypothetical protein N2259_00695 [Patescibacteria group bacterium]|nr:hypothetical protein [Patescibacteria group bacterium]
MQPDDIIEPSDEVNPLHEEIIGEIADENIKKLYTLSLNLEKSAFMTFGRAMVTAMFENQRDGDILNKTFFKSYEFRTKAQILRDIFWVCVQDTFDLWDKSKIGIRKGFIVVAIKDVKDKD